MSGARSSDSETAPDGEPLAGGWQTTVRRSGDVIHRSAGPWSAAVMALLRHLEEVGFTGSPRPVGSGFDGEGNETVTFIEGASLQPDPWTDDGITALGRMVSDLHRATASFQPPPTARWKVFHGRPADGGGEQPGRDAGIGFGHGDLGPWNIMAIDGLPVGFIDWDTAGPLDPMWELAQMGWLNAQLHDDDLAARLGLGDARSRARQLRLLLDGYGLPTERRAGFVDRMVAVAVHAARAEALTHDVTPETTDGVDEAGYPFAWGMAWRIGGASWMLRNRRLLQRAIDAP